MSIGSKLIVAGAVSAVSAALVDALLRGGLNLDPITLWGVSLPAPFAIVVLVAISGAVGWAGWAYLRQAQRLMLRLEFDIGANPDDIKTALTGSSLVSTSVLLLKSLCVIALFASAATGTPLFFWLFRNVLPLPFLFVTYLALPLPFFLVAFFSPRMRYFNPDNWNSAIWLFRRATKDFRRQIKKVGNEINEFPWAELSEGYRKCDISNAWRKLDDMTSKAVPTAFAASMGRLFRKHGLKLFLPGLRGGLIREELDEELGKSVSQTVNEVLEKLFEEELSGLELDEQKALWYYIRNNVFELPYERLPTEQVDQERLTKKKKKKKRRRRKPK